MTNPDAVVVGYYAGRLTVQLVGRPASVLPIGTGLWLTPPGECTQQVRAAVQAERERLYALLDTDPALIWRDAGFQEWRARRSQESE